MSLLFKNCSILVRDPGTGVHSVIADGFLGVEDTKIDYIGAKAPEKKYDAEKDMSGKLLMPGMVNAHGHSAMTLTRGVGSGLSLQDWLEKAIFPVEAKMTPEDIQAGMSWAILEMLACGTTLVADMYDFPWAGGEVLMASGMKANICRVGLSFSEDEEVPPNRFAECVDLVKNWQDPSGRVRADFCLHSEYLTTEKFVRQIAEANAELKAGVHVHVSETEKEQRECIARHGMTPIAYLNETGILDQKVYAAHCVYVTDEDADIMKEKGVTAVHNPSSNMKLGSGFARIQYLLGKGVNVALGTDGVASNNNLNMFEEMHLASLIHKGIAKDPTVLTCDQLLDMATVNGARALGRDNTGSLEIGKDADIIAVSLEGPHMYPAFDLPSLLCYSAQGSDVTMTMVDGQILYENGEYFTVDREMALFDLKNALSHLY